MTLPTCYSWFPRGKALSIPYEAPKGQRVNTIGAYFSHGPLAGRFCHESFASLPKHAREAKRKTPEQVAASYGLRSEEVGPIDADRFIAFVWKAAGRPEPDPSYGKPGGEPGCKQDWKSDWKRERPLVLFVDNYQVHRCQAVLDERAAWERADIYVVFLPAYSPELSEIEPIWNDVKHHQISRRSYQRVSELKQAVDQALTLKAERLMRQTSETTKDLCMAA
jgi:hypothetical protein